MPMHFAYVDDSGGEKSYTLGCVLMEAVAWPDLFDEMLDFRRFLRARYGLPVRVEVKANHILRNSGAFRPLKLSESARFSLYRGFMRLHSKLQLQAFAVVIRKDEARAAGGPRPRPVSKSS